MTLKQTARGDTLDRDREAERRRRENARLRAVEADGNHRVLAFAEWCELNGFSPATGRRIIKGGTGPVVTQLSQRRFGVTIGNNRAWQASRARGGAL